MTRFPFPTATRFEPPGTKVKPGPFESTVQLPTWAPSGVRTMVGRVRSSPRSIPAERLHSVLIDPGAERAAGVALDVGLDRIALVRPDGQPAVGRAWLKGMKRSGATAYSRRSSSRDA